MSIIDTITNKLFPQQTNPAPSSYIGQPANNGVNASFAPAPTPLWMSGTPKSTVPAGQGGGGGGGGSWGPIYPTPTGAPITVAPKPKVTSTKPTVAPVTYTPPVQTTPAPVGSVGALPGASNMYTPSVNPDQAEIDRLNGIVGDTSQETDPNTIYQNTLSQYQSQIDAINNMFNDALNNSRITNAPTYKARLDQNRIGQVMGGLVQSPMGQAQTNNIDTANRAEQTAAEAEINARRANALNTINGEIRKQSTDLLAANKLAKSKGADAMLEFYNVTKPAMKAKQISSAIKALLDQGITDLTDEEIKSYTDGLGISKDEFISAISDESSNRAAAAAKGEEQSLKNEKLKADTAKTLAETGQVGKMTPYQAASLAIERERLSKDSQTNQQYTQSAAQGMSSTISQTADQNGFLTPVQYKAYKSQWVAETGLPGTSFDAYFADKAYTKDVDKNAPYTIAQYGISAAGTKTLPETE